VCAVHPDRQSCRRRVQRNTVGANSACDLRCQGLAEKHTKASPHERRVRKRLKNKIDQPKLASNDCPSHLRQRKRALEKPTRIRIVFVAEDARVSHDKPAAN
jgi:hypothetical protein